MTASDRRPVRATSDESRRQQRRRAGQRRIVTDNERRGQMMGEQPGAAIEGFLFRNPDFPLGISLFENPEPAFILLPIDICGFQSYLRDFSANHKYRTRKTTRSNSLPRPTQNSRRIRSLRTDRPPGPAKIPERAPTRLLLPIRCRYRDFFPSRHSCTKPTFEFSQKKFPQKKALFLRTNSKTASAPTSQNGCKQRRTFPDI